MMINALRTLTRLTSRYAGELCITLALLVLISAYPLALPLTYA